MSHYMSPRAVVYTHCQVAKIQALHNESNDELLWVKMIYIETRLSHLAIFLKLCTKGIFVLYLFSKTYTISLRSIYKGLKGT